MQCMSSWASFLRLQVSQVLQVEWRQVVCVEGEVRVVERLKGKEWRVGGRERRRKRRRGRMWWDVNGMVGWIAAAGWELRRVEMGGGRE